MTNPFDHLAKRATQKGSRESGAGQSGSDASLELLDPGAGQSGSDASLELLDDEEDPGDDLYWLNKD